LGWLEDPRWFLVRNVVHVLCKIADESALDPVVRLLGHPHMRVRIEALRTLALIAPARAARPILPLSRDTDAEVRLEAIRALGALRRDEALPVLHEIAAGAGDATDLVLREEAVEALAALGTAGACEALAALARRRVWPCGAPHPGDRRRRARRAHRRGAGR
jgi:HEAT repeat protein